MRYLFALAWLAAFLIPAQSVHAQTGTIKGRVFDALGGEPLAGAQVVIRSVNKGALADDEGLFEISGLAPDLYNVEVSLLGYQPRTLFEIQVTASRLVTLDVGLEPDAKTGPDSIIIRASPFNKTTESPVSIRTIGVNEIQRNPGGNRDISRVIQSLPGVAGSVAFRNDIIIRGGAPNENRFYLDGVEVPNINHFSTQGASGGPVGMINVDFIREVDFFSGAFPANRGNMLSSLMDIKLKNGKEDKLGFRGTVGSSDLALTAEGPIGKKTTFIASARRSYLQGLFTLLGLPFLPTYNDFQFKVNSKLNSKNELTVLGLGAIDRSVLNLAADSTDEQRYLLDYLPSYYQWNYTMGINWKHYTANGVWNLVASRNMLNNESVKYQDNDESDPANLVLNYTSREMENKLRWELTRMAGAFKLNYGVSYEFARYTNETFNRISTPGGLVTVNFNSALDMHKYGGFAQLSRSFFTNRLAASAGLRMDGSSYNENMRNPLRQISPRLSLAYSLTEKWSLNFNTGYYHQLAPYTVLGYRDDNGALVNKDRLSYVRNAHLIGGVEYDYQESGKITVEGFYKRYYDYPFLLRDSISLANLGGDFGVVGNEPAASTSEGRAYGLEFMVQQKLWKGFYGILSVTLVRSEFTDGSGSFKPSAWDNRGILTFTGGKKFKGNWEIGARWRYYGGTPYTPIDVARSSLIPVWDITGRGLPDYSQLNTLRIAAAHQLDARIDKKWFFKKWSLNLYLDVQNVYGFKAALAPNLDVVRDVNGNPVVDPGDPSRYLTRFVPNTTGTVLPTIGVVIELN